jgi:hypothetical protein
VLEQKDIMAKDWTPRTEAPPMPGMRDRNLRSGDLHEELGILLLKAIALVAPVPRQEDVGNDAFATLIQPEGNRRLIPDVSCLVQLKSSSVASVSYTTPEEMAWISALDSPLFIGRVDLKQARIELFTTLRLHQILLEHDYNGIELLLNQADGISIMPNVRQANLGPPIHAWDDAHRTTKRHCGHAAGHGPTCSPAADGVATPEEVRRLSGDAGVLRPDAALGSRPRSGRNTL